MLVPLPSRSRSPVRFNPSSVKSITQALLAFVALVVASDRAVATDLSVQVGIDQGEQRLGAWFDVGFIVGNAEPAAVSRYRVVLYGSRDDALDTGDRRLGEFQSRRPIEGVSFQENSLRIDSCRLGEGTWRILAALADTDPVDENPANDLAIAGRELQILPGGVGRCAENLVNAGLNDAWFDPETSGQGVLVTVLPQSGQLFLGWFTFSPLGEASQAEARLGGSEQRWLTALGPFQERVARLTVANSSGGIFDEPDSRIEFDTDYGDLRAEFEDCNRMRLHYTLPTSGLTGVIALQRVVEDNVALCEALLDAGAGD